MNPCKSLTVVFWEARKGKLGILLGFSLITAFKSYTMRHFAGKTQEQSQIRKNKATITRHQLKKPCAPNEMVNARSLNFAKLRFLRSVFKVEKIVLSIKHIVFNTFRAF